MIAKGFEPLTHSLKGYCSTCWAKRSYYWVSLRLVPDTPSGLVHIYIPHNGATVRSRTLSSWADTTLVGLTFTASAMLPSLCLYYSTEFSICQELFLKPQFYFLGFRLHLLLSRSAPLRNDWWKNWETPHGIGLFRRNPLELLLCLYCITSWAVCQELFWGRWWESNPLSQKANVSKGATLLYLSLFIGGSPFYLTAICTLIVSQLGRFVKGFFTFFFERKHSTIASP